MQETKINVTSKNGVNILIYPRAEAMSVSMGIFFNVGAWHERPRQAGIAHFIEHMLFKSSESHTTKQISEKFASYGAHWNAFTDWDKTCYHATVPHTKARETFALLTEIVRTPKILDKELETERKAILSEIDMRKDNKATMTVEAAHSILFSADGSRFCGRVIGRPDTVKRLHSKDLRRFYEKNYTASNTFIVVVGNVGDPEKFCGYVLELWSDLKTGTYNEPPKIRSLEAGDNIVNMQAEQARVVQFFRKDVESYHDETYPIDVLAAIYGLGMSSRVFQEIREKRGLAYAAHGDLYRIGPNILLLSSYVGTEPKHVEKVKILLGRIQDNLSHKKLGAKELAKAKQSVCGLFMIDHDDNSSFMHRAAIEFMFDTRHPFDTYRFIDRINAVTAEQVEKVAAEIFFHCDSVTVTSMDTENKKKGKPEHE